MATAFGLLNSNTAHTLQVKLKKVPKGGSIIVVVCTTRSYLTSLEVGQHSNSSYSIFFFFFFFSLRRQTTEINLLFFPLLLVIFLSKKLGLIISSATK